MKRETKKRIDMIALWLVLVGGINWGLAVFDFNLVNFIASYTFGIVENIVYAGVGLSSIWIGWKSTIGKLFK